MLELQAIVLDMDGLLLDSERVSEALYVELLAELGHTMSPAFYRQMVGLRERESYAMVIDAFHLDLSPDDLHERLIGRWRDRVQAGIPTMPGVFEFHAAVTERGIPWGIATASPRWYAEQNVAALGWGAACGAIAAGDEVRESKPAPDVYLLAADRLGVAPERCLALEDSDPGCRAAAAAGMRVGVVPNEYTASAEFACAHHRFNSLLDVIPLLDEWEAG